MVFRHPASQSIMPAQFDVLKQVYDAIVAEPWFHNTDETRQDISDLVMRHYRLGRTEPADLLRECATIARERYSSD